MVMDAGGKSLQPGDPRLLMRWARRYAKSRTISFLVQWVFIVAMVMVIGMAAAMTEMAHKTNSRGLFYVSVLTMGLAVVILTWFSVAPWGSEVIWRITQWLYGREGWVSSDEGEASPTPWWLVMLGGGLVVYHLVGALLVSFNVLGLQWMQPYSAAYMAPFLALLIVYQGLGFWAWCWPVLYAAHAVLLWLGWMPMFRGSLVMLNMVVPVFGYGLVAIIVGHLYSRFALWKLRSLARSGLDATADSEEETPEEPRA